MTQAFKSIPSSATDSCLINSTRHLPLHKIKAAPQKSLSSSISELHLSDFAAPFVPDLAILINQTRPSASFPPPHKASRVLLHHTVTASLPRSHSAPRPYSKPHAGEQLHRHIWLRQRIKMLSALRCHFPRNLRMRGYPEFSCGQLGEN